MLGEVDTTRIPCEGYDSTFPKFFLFKTPAIFYFISNPYSP